MKTHKYKDLIQVFDRCDHPERDIIKSAADSWGMFTYYCQKCGTTFSRYDYDYIEEQRKINSGGVDYESAYRIYQ